MAGLEAAARVPLTNIQQISPDLFLGQQLRRPIVMLRQRPDRLEAAKPASFMSSIMRARNGDIVCSSVIEDGTIPSRRRR